MAGLRLCGHYLELLKNTKYLLLLVCLGHPQRFPRWLSDKENCLPMQEMQETQVRSLGREDPLEKEMATDSSVLV